MSSAPLSDPITWVSDDPHLSGAFAPIGPEIEAADLTVLSGAIPADLKGTYFRNGPNPRFQPDAAPVAVIRMPQRVPAGLHGIWVPG